MGCGIRKQSAAGLLWSWGSESRIAASGNDSTDVLGRGGRPLALDGTMSNGLSLARGGDEERVEMHVTSVKMIMYVSGHVSHSRIG